MINEELIKRVMKQIEAEPSLWNQEDFFTSWDIVTNRYVRLPEAVDVANTGRCKSTYCFAGWALFLEGEADSVGRLRHTSGDNGEEDFFVPECSSEYSERAADLLGLDEHKADWIFLYVRDEDGYPVTVQQLKERVSVVTGVKFDD